ncbi:hypothetical protein M9Y10_032265 [Tritrichomonas musculus]|uniref:Serine aminopeptidase S33 domain-containing protein n=1 Tax=Tritrichomonas musculus TaxID=1915356 RepID=A0ABR2H1F0_9EUKA
MILLYIIILLLILFICFYAYRKSLNYYPNIYFNPNGNISHLIAQTKSLEKPYRPTWWLFNCHLHTIRGMRYRKSSKMTKSVRRELITYEDGGTSALDWFETAEMKNDTPILFIIHTCAGGTREPCSNNMAEAGVKRGWRSVVFNNRCCSGAPITSSRMIAILQIDDLVFAVNHIRKNFNPKYMFMAGFSHGAYQTVQYALYGEGIDAAACISESYDPTKAKDILCKPIQGRLYLPVIMAKLTHFAKKNPYLNNPAAENAKNPIEYDEAIWCHGLTEFTSGMDLYAALKVYDKIPKIKIPTLFLGAEDDPLTSKDLMPIKEVQKSENVALVSFPEGGHVSFLTGNDAQKSIMDTIIPDWFESVINDKENNSN